MMKWGKTKATYVTGNYDTAPENQLFRSDPLKIHKIQIPWHILILYYLSFTKPLFPFWPFIVHVPVKEKKKFVEKSKKEKKSIKII